ncbi:sigma-54-dependent Fis family transcriptional regulator [bacterium]|nr:sigma-54-dependent Fis family transcriptional regulator [bacterium]
MSETTILVVDDEPGIIAMLSGLLKDEGYAVVTADSGREALNQIKQTRVDLVMLDLRLPDLDGLEVLRRIRFDDATLPVIMMSAHGTIPTAVEATKLGAYDFIEKPFESAVERLLLVIEHALNEQKLKQENINLRRELSKKYEMVGESKAMEFLYKQIMKIAPSNGRVLITGETGTGKELAARAIHQNSKRSDRPFIKVNCAAIPEELIESELFGHEKGSFTGAISTQVGKFEQANRGTLFLDEVGDMSLSTQAKVLRTLQENEIQRVGGNKVIEVDVRVITATNKNLEQEINEGRFRKDLFYRLNVIPLHIPPLRERKEDIPLLVNHFIQQFCRENGKRIKSISPEAMELLKRHDWSGNVRELRNIIERMIIVAEGDEISANDVATAISVKDDIPTGEESLRELVEQYEKKLTLDALVRNDWNVSRTARELKTDRANLHRKLRQWNVRYG